MPDHAETIVRFAALFRTTELPSTALGAWIDKLAPFSGEEVRASFRRLETGVARQVGTPELPRLATVLADLRAARSDQGDEPPRHNERCELHCRDGQVLVVDRRGYRYPAACRCWAGRQWALTPLDEARAAGLSVVPDLLAHTAGQPQTGERSVDAGRESSRVAHVVAGTFGTFDEPTGED